MPGIGVRDLHGHDYRARVAVHGELDPTDKLVFDFLGLKRIMRRLCGEILAKRLHAELNALDAHGLTSIELEIEESFGQSATYRMPLQ